MLGVGVGFCQLLKLWLEENLLPPFADLSIHARVDLHDLSRSESRVNVEVVIFHNPVSSGEVQAVFMRFYE